MASVRFGSERLQAQRHPQLQVGDDCLLCIRPHEVSLSPLAEAHNTLKATVQSVVWQGDLHSIALEMRGLSRCGWSCTPMRDPPRPGYPLELHFSAQDSILIPVDHSRACLAPPSTRRHASAALPYPGRACERNSGAGLWIVPPLLILAGSFFYPLTLVLGQAVLSDAGPPTLAALRRGVPIRPLSKRHPAYDRDRARRQRRLPRAGLHFRADPDLRAVSRRPRAGAADRHVHRACRPSWWRSRSPSSTARPGCSTRR